MIHYLVPQASSYAHTIDWLFDLIFYTVGFWFVVAQAVLFWLIFRFRRRPGAAAQYITGEQHAEKRWIARPHFLVILCDVVIILVTVSAWGAIKQQLPPADETVRVVGQQWAWTFVQPGPDGKLGTDDDIVTVDELHVQEGKTYHFELTSKDVVHGFFVPALRIKQDAVPGRTIVGWFKPTRRGRYDIACSMICGIGHALMPARLVVESQTEHDAWMRSQRP